MHACLQLLYFGGKATFLNNNSISAYTMQESFHRSGPSVYGRKEEEDKSEEEGERYFMHLACYHG